MPTQRLHGYSCNHVTICCQLSQYKTYVIEGSSNRSYGAKP